ncbi:MAG TPA: hypothetical protein VFY86_10905 [Nocardioides sp.]|nr:hypothetical protein [Nocardioides sp.]
MYALSSTALGASGVDSSISSSPLSTYAKEIDSMTGRRPSVR